jgi:hypothetical protein
MPKCCSIDGCERPHNAKGLCKRHYAQSPDQRAQAQKTERKRRRTPEYRERDRARLEQRRRARGVPARATPTEKAAQRRTAKHQRATLKLIRAAAGKRGSRTWIAGPCESCGEAFVRSTNCTCCSKLCRRRVDRRKRRDAYGNHRERARHYGVPYEPVNKRTIFKRDGYRCQLCGLKTRGEWPNPKAPTLDHIVPMVHRGPHVASNLQCAHAECNSLKGERAANEQLRLVG